MQWAAGELALGSREQGASFTTADCPLPLPDKSVTRRKLFNALGAILRPVDGRRVGCLGCDLRGGMGQRQPRGGGRQARFGWRARGLRRRQRRRQTMVSVEGGDHFEVLGYRLDVAALDRRIDGDERLLDPRQLQMNVAFRRLDGARRDRLADVAPQRRRASPVSRAIAS